MRMGIQGVMGAVAMMAGKAMGLAVIKVDVLMLLTDEGVQPRKQGRKRVWSRRRRRRERMRNWGR